MCDYCSQDNTEESLEGGDGIMYDKEKDKHYLYIEHFRNEKYFIKVNYCPECGKQLKP